MEQEARPKAHTGNCIEFNKHLQSIDNTMHVVGTGYG